MSACEWFGGGSSMRPECGSKLRASSVLDVDWFDSKLDAGSWKPGRA